MNGTLIRFTVVILAFNIYLSEFSIFFKLQIGEQSVYRTIAVIKCRVRDNVMLLNLSQKVGIRINVV